MLLTSILLLSLERVTSTPQLRLSQTGYEIISFDDQTTDDSLPTATKLTLQNGSRHNEIRITDLEKSESVDNNYETLMDRLNKLQLPLQLPMEHKPHNLPKGIDIETISQIHRNAEDKSVKGFSIVSSGKTKEFSSETNSRIISKNSLDDSHEKESSWTNNSRFDEKKSKKASKIVKQSIFIEPSDKLSIDSDSKEDLKLDKITAIVTDFHQSFDKIGTKSNSEEKQEKIHPIFQIHRQKNVYLPSKSSSKFSPIYTSGFDNVAKNFVKKSVLSINEPQTHTKNFQSDTSTNGVKAFAKSNHPIKISTPTLKSIFDNTNRDFNSRTINRFPFASVLPVTGTSLYVSPFSLMLQKSLRNHHSADLSTFHSQGRFEDFINSVNDAPKINFLDNYLENKYFDSKVNKRMEIMRSKNDFFKKYFRKIPSISQTPNQKNLVNKPAEEISNLPNNGLVIDIVHGIAPENSEEMIFDNKENSAKVQKIPDTLQAPFHSSMYCKHMKPIIPPFYQFLTKFSDILLDNAQKYEKSLKIDEGVANFIEAVKKKNSANL